MKRKRYNSKNVTKGIQRKLQIEAGSQDGRFAHKVVPDKKKQKNRQYCKHLKD